MAFLDMSDVITDPDLCESADGALQYIRIAQVVGLDGMASNNEAAPVNFSGVVCAKDGKRIERTDAAEEVFENITVHSLTRLSAGQSPDVPADIVLWNGNRYTVVNTNSYSNFGAGFVMAECQLIPVKGGT